MPSKIQPNGIVVGSVSTLPTCDATIQGKLVFNTSDNKMYYCNGTDWVVVPSPGGEPVTTNVSLTESIGDTSVFQQCYLNSHSGSSVWVPYDWTDVKTVNVTMNTDGYIIACATMIATNNSSGPVNTKIRLVIDGTVVDTSTTIALFKGSTSNQYGAWLGFFTVSGFKHVEAGTRTVKIQAYIEGFYYFIYYNYMLRVDKIETS